MTVNWFINLLVLKNKHQKKSENFDTKLTLKTSQQTKSLKTTFNFYFRMHLHKIRIQ